MLYHSRQILDIETAESTRQIICEFEVSVTMLAPGVFKEQVSNVAISHDNGGRFFDVAISHDNGGRFFDVAFFDMEMIIGAETFGEMMHAAKTAVRDSNDYAKDFAANANG